MLNRKTIIVSVIVTIFFILAILILRHILIKNQEQAEFETKIYDVLNDFDTVEEVSKYLECEYIKEIESPNENFEKDIYIKFKYDLYTDGASNQEYYYSAVILFAQVTGYKNIRLIDDSRELLIAIIGDTSKKTIQKLYINGSENYFGEQDTIKALENYKSANVSRIEIQAQILKDLINNNWDVRTIDFGTQESTFDGYDIYFDEGIEIKTVGTKIFNIVFTNNYKGAIVNDISTDRSFKDIVNMLGNPSFGKIEDQIIGYKGEKLYIFFDEDRISVYPVDKNEKEQELLRLIEEFRQSRNVRKFISSITDMWPEYDKYEYDSDYVDLEYTLKGVKFTFNLSTNNGITFYNNYNGSYISDLRQNRNDLPEYTYFEDTNLIYEAEKEAQKSSRNYKKTIREYESYKKEVQEYSQNKNLNDNPQFIASLKNNCLRVISINGDYPPFEINDCTGKYRWLDNNILAYSIKNKGIYLVSAETREKNTLIEGADEFNLKGYTNGFIYYDDKYLIYGRANTGMNTYVWIDNARIAYSVKNKGIYIYNVATQSTSTLIEGEDEFNITGYENGQIYYDTSVVYVLD